MKLSRLWPVVWGVAVAFSLAFGIAAGLLKAPAADLRDLALYLIISTVLSLGLGILAFR